MVKLFILIVLLIGCNTPLYKLNDKVRITKGFYRGLEGTLLKYYTGLDPLYKISIIKGTPPFLREEIVVVNEDDLELIND